MKGGIYSDERCPVCGGTFRDNGKTGLFCPKHPEHRAMRLVIRFGNLTKRFTDYNDALQILGGFRFETRKGTFDERDYQKSKPLGFTTLAHKWLVHRKGQVRCHRNLRNHILRATAYFGDTNIKYIQYGELEDFLQTLQGTSLSSKTQKNIFTTLHAFFVWCHKREGIPVPEFPAIKFELGWRNTVDKATQQAIIEEVKRISYGINPKIWVGIKWLATYYKIRPIELIHIKERDINYETNTVTVWYSKTEDPKIIYFLGQDISLARSFGPAFPNLFFFRHIKGNGAVRPAQRFGKDYLWKWWTRACKNLGIQDIDLYGGTRHSTVRHLAGTYTPEQIKEGGWKTNRAFDRYFGPLDAERERRIYDSAAGSVVSISANSGKRNTHTIEG